MRYLIPWEAVKEDHTPKDEARVVHCARRVAAMGAGQDDDVCHCIRERLADRRRTTNQSRV